MIIKSRERWKLITHIENKEYKFNKNYYISNYGRVKTDNSYLTLRERKLYYQATLYIVSHGKSKRKMVTVHRLVYEYFGEELLDADKEVHHKDKNTINNYYKNLQQLLENDHKNEHKKEFQLKREKVKNTIGKLIVTDKYSTNKLFNILNKDDETISKNLICDIKRDYFPTEKKFTFDEIDIICKLLENQVNDKYIVDYMYKKYDLIINKDTIKKIRHKEIYKDISDNYKFPSQSKDCLSEKIVIKICEMIKNEKTDVQIYNFFKHNYRHVTINKIELVRNRTIYTELCTEWFNDYPVRE